MWGKILFLMILVISLVFASWILYQNIPGEAEELKTILINAGSGRGQEVIEYGDRKSPAVNIESLSYPIFLYKKASNSST